MIAKKIASALSFLFLVFILGCSGDSDSLINILVTDILINPNQTSITVGGTQQLSPAIAPADATDQTVTWSSDNTSVATVNSSGLVTGIAAGTATITVAAKDGSNKTAKAIITVQPEKILVTSISITPGNLTITERKDGQLKVVIAPTNATDKTVTWSSDNTSVASIDQDGLIYARTAGTATITAFAKDGSNKIARVVITVIPKVLITNISITPGSATTVAGETTQLSTVITPANASNQNVTWSSDNTAIATVSASGLVKGFAAGTVTITVTTQDGNKTAQASITVTKATLPAADVLTTFEFKNHTYYIIKQAKTWPNAVAYAVKYGGYLVEINSNDEQIEIQNRIDALTGNPFGALGTVDDGGGAKYLWIGASDQIFEGHWVFDGDNRYQTYNIPIGEGNVTQGGYNPSPYSNAYNNWGSINQGEPDDFNSDQDAAAMAVVASTSFGPQTWYWPNGNKYQWNDIMALNNIWFIMEVNN